MSYRIVYLGETVEGNFDDREEAEAVRHALVRSVMHDSNPHFLTSEDFEDYDHCDRSFTIEEDV